MKLSMPQARLASALEKGALAALSNTINTNEGMLGFLSNSIKITVDKKIMFESYGDLFSTRYQEEIDSSSDIKVESEGSILVPAKELIQWIKAQGKDSIISMELDDDDGSKLVALGGTDDTDTDSAFTIKVNGTVKLASESASRVKSKWELTNWDPDQSPVVSYKDKDKGEEIFEVCAGEFLEAIKRVSFAAFEGHTKHVLDNISVQNVGDDMYFAATDSKRCALYKFSNNKTEKPILIPIKTVNTISKIIDKGLTVKVFYNQDECKIYMCQSNMDIRMLCQEDKTFAKFKTIQPLVEKEYDVIGNIKTTSFTKLLKSASLVNKRSAMFEFSKDRKEVVVTAVSENGSHKPTVSTMPLDNIQIDVKSAWGVTHLMELCKATDSENICLNYPKQGKSLKVVGVDEPELTYFSMPTDNPKYRDS